MSERNFTQERIELRRDFKDVLDSLRALWRHKSGLYRLDEEEFEHHSLNVGMGIDSINEMINEHMQLLDPPEQKDGDNKDGPGKSTQSSN